MSGLLCAVVNITKQGNLNNNFAYSATLGIQETSDSNQAKKNKNSDNSINKAEFLQTTEKSCQGSLTIPPISGSIKSGQSKSFLGVKDQRSVCMNKKDIVTTNVIGLTELKNAETTFTFLY